MSKITVPEIKDLGFTAEMFDKARDAEVIGTDGLNYTAKSSHIASSANKPITGANYATVWYQAGQDGIDWADGVGNEAQFYTFLGEIIDDQAAELEALITTETYNDSTTLTARRVKKAELYLVAAELLKRRINKQLGNVTSEGQPISTKNEREQMKAYQAEAEDLIRILMGDSDFAFGTEKTSHFNDDSSLS